MVNGMAELATPAAWLLAKIAHRAISSRSALPSGRFLIGISTSISLKELN
jgi:hypothetical protein